MNDRLHRLYTVKCSVCITMKSFFSKLENDQEKFSHDSEVIKQLLIVTNTVLGRV